MALKLITAMKIDPPKIIPYGGPGIGKTTFAANSGALIVDCENGAGAILGAIRTPYLKTWPEIRQWLNDIANEQIEQRVVAIDTIDWCVRRIIEHVIIDLDGKRPQEITNTISTAHGGFNRAKDIIINVVSRELLPTLNVISGKGVAIMLLAHAAHKEITTPEGHTVRTAAPDLPDWLRPIFIEWADCVLYGYMDGNGSRVFRTIGTSNIIAKNRYGMPEVIEMSWDAVLACLRERSKTIKEKNNG